MSIPKPIHATAGLDFDSEKQFQQRIFYTMGCSCLFRTLGVVGKTASIHQHCPSKTEIETEIKTELSLFFSFSLYFSVSIQL